MIENNEKFVPIYSLEKLTDEQKHEYYLSVCEFLDLPPQLNLLEYMFMENGTGRNLILYCKRGGTDLIRQNRGISVIELSKDIIDGYIIFTAKGQDKTGRIEMAVGAASIKGGKDLSSQIAVAQTRACRRMTLQFVGGGILDESEAVSSAVQTPQAYSDVQPAVQPQTAPNTSAGTDTTPVTEQNPLIQGVSLQESAKTRRPKRKTGVDLTAGWEPLEQPVKAVPTPEPIAVLPVPDILVESPVVDILVESPVVDIVPIDLPSQEQLSQFRKKISDYTNNILPQAGMMPTENVGGVGQKVRILASKMFPDTTDMKNLSLPQWTLFFEFMDGTLAKVGAKELVRLINSKIGIGE